MYDHNPHHMGGFGGTAAWFILFIFLFILVGGPVLNAGAKALNHLPGSVAEEPIQ